MSKKRTSPGSINDDDENETSDSVFQQQHTAKRVKLTSFSDTTVQDLPIELLECILDKVVAMEVKGMKLAKSVWKEKADLVISGLRTVCSQWSSILTTDFFRNKIHKALDATAQETIRLEILHQLPIRDQLRVIRVTAMKDEIFVLCNGADRDYMYFINVYDRNNMVEVKDVIPLSGFDLMELVACSVSNSVYTLSMKCNEVNRHRHCSAVLRITRDEQHQFYITPWISDVRMSSHSISVSDNGSLIIVSEGDNKLPSTVLSMYTANGSLQHEIVMSLDRRCSTGNDRVIPKSNGNLILVSAGYLMKTRLTEVDMTGRIIRQYQSSLSDMSIVKCAYACERILICDQSSTMELLDSEFNLLDLTCSALGYDLFDVCYDACYNGERNEIVGMSQRESLIICGLKEE